MRKLEILSPAKNADIAIEAVRHGADAVYIGPPSHGARKSASNSIDDIRKAIDFAHRFDARVYVTVNTLVYDREIPEVERLIRQLYRIGVDALIVQDMGILRMDIPPIALHASTQCDIRTPEKARFLEQAGFSQLVLARELTIDRIREICKAVTIPVETFVHGALCVSYSGRCSAGYACAGRSGNRGECPQICRQSFMLLDASERVIARDKYLLSLKDFNAHRFLPELIDAGVSSFKIEGRLKEADYVKNVTAFYSQELNRIITEKNASGQDGEPEFARASLGNVSLSFTPALEKSFNRGFTSYCLTGTPDSSGLASIHTPKSLGEPIGNLDMLKPGDGISFFDRDGDYKGMLVNAVKDGKIYGNKGFALPKGAEIRRTASVEWKKTLAGNTAERRIPIDISFDSNKVSATIPGVAIGANQAEERAMMTLSHDLNGEPAKKPADYRSIFEKLGNTPFVLRNFSNDVPELFYPASALTALRRQLIESLEAVMKINYKFDYRRTESRDYPYPSKTLVAQDNVANRLAERFYEDHGVEKIIPALETEKNASHPGQTLMTSKHCILREVGLCLNTRPDLKQPLRLISGPHKFTLSFDCNSCEMRVNEV